MKNIIQKIETAANTNGLQLNISGDKKTLTFYGKTLDHPYKIISPVNSCSLFESLCNHLVQTKNCQMFSQGDLGYKASFIDGDYKVEIQKAVNGYDIICVYKVK